MILTDQMHKKAMGHIDSNIITPNLDHLLKDSVSYTNAYSNNPVCGPFRGCLFTGRYTCENEVYENNFPLPDKMVTMADIFNVAGYNTSFVGKWHLGGKGNGIIPKEIRGGFNHFIGYQCYNGYWVDNYFYNEDNVELGFDGHRTDITTNLGLERLGKLADDDKPFLHVIFYQSPHYPEQPRTDIYKMYENSQVTFPVNYEDADPYTPTHSPRSPRPFEYCQDYQRYSNNMTEYKKLYNAMVTQIDEGVGKFVAMLKELQIYDDTMILFSSDHGDMQGSHGMINKCQPFEESCGIPLIVKGDLKHKGQIVDLPVSSIDYLTTAMDYCSIDNTLGLEGRNILDIAVKPENYLEDYVVAENYIKEDYWTMIRDKRHKLVIDTFTKECRYLFDMEKDPYEMINLVDDDVCQSIMTKLLRTLDAWFEERRKKPTTSYDRSMVSA